RPEGKAFAPQEKDKKLPVAPQEKRMDKIDEAQEVRRPVEKMVNAYTTDDELEGDGLVVLPARTNRSSSQSMMQMTPVGGPSEKADHLLRQLLRLADCLN
ncbi:unnamed protein product, partial [Amoebophrya sp. A25]